MSAEGPVRTIDMQLQGDQADVSVAVHIVRGEDRIAMIDSGLVWGYDQIESGLAAAQIAKADVDLLLNTHEHMDHIGNNARLARETGCLIGAHPRYAAWIEDHALGADRMVRRFPFAEPVFDPEPEYLAWMEREEAPVHLHLTEATTVNLGGGVTLEVLELPGHSLSEIGFYEHSTGTLIFGDVLMPDDVPVLYLYEDPNAMRASCRRVARLLRERDVNLVLSGHGRPSGAEEGIAWALDCLARIDRIEQEILSAIERTPGIARSALRDVVTDALGKHREWRALITIDGHLRDLVDRGLIVREGETWSAVRERTPGVSGMVTVLGSGVMGAGIAVSTALGGFSTTIWGRRDAGLAEAGDAVAAALDRLVEAGLQTREAVDEARSRIGYERTLATAVAASAFVIDAVSEDLAAKHEVLLAAERAAPETVVLASTTSALSPTLLAQPLARPERFVVTHFAQPAELAMLVEVVPGRATAEEVVVIAEALLEGCGKRPVRCPDIPGFLWSRLQQTLLREFTHLIDQGLATPEACDAVLKFGFAHRLPVMGIFEHADLAGLELIEAQAQAVWPDLARERTPVGGQLTALRTRGLTGMRVGHGFYRWEDGQADAFRRARDEEIIRRLKLLRGDAVGQEHPAEEVA